MNSIKICQEQLRNKRRTHQLQNFKANSRNALLYFSSNSNICSLCSDYSWMNNSNSHHTITLVFTIFTNGQTCPQHSNLLIEKTKQSLLKVPNQFRKLMTTIENKKETKQQVIKKIVLLLQLLDEKLFNLYQELGEQIKDSFNGKDTFIIHLMDCAYGYCQWPIDEEGLGDEQWHYEIRTLSLQTILSIFTKFPLMVCAFLEQYPFQTLLSKTSNSNKLYLYQYISFLFQHCSITAMKDLSTLIGIECSLANHLQEIIKLIIPNEVIKGLACWIMTILRTGLPLQCRTLSLIVQFLHITSLCFDSSAVIISLLSSNYASMLQIHSELRRQFVSLERHASAMELQS